MPSSAPPVLTTLLALLVGLSGCTGKGGEPGRRGVVTVEGARPEAAAAAEGPRMLETTCGPVRLQVLPNFDLLDVRKAPTEISVLLRLRGEGEARGERPPLDLAVILDRSGSMAGDKLLAVKQATLDLLKELRPSDHLTLIAYDDLVEVLTERVASDAAGADRARAAVLALTDRGGTALGPGLYRGLEILAAAQRGERELAHVMLLSDGQANVGEQNPEVLAARAGEGFRGGTSVSTLGVGLDYNEDLMTKIADQGGGRYHFIQGTDAIPRVLADEFAGLVATVAAGVTLELRPAPGVEVVRVFGYPARAEAGATRIPVGSLAAQQAREIVVRLRVSGAEGEEAALAVAALQASDLQGQKVRCDLAAALRTSSDEAAIRRSERTEVTVRVAEVESAAQLEAAARAVDGGDYDKARQVLRDSLVQLEAQQAATPSPKLAGQIQELKEAELGIDAAKMSAQEQKIYLKKQKARAYNKAK